MAIAVRGQGAWATGLEGDSLSRLHVSTRGDPSAARLLRSFEPTHTGPAKMDALVRLLGLAVLPLLMDSQAKYALLASGEGDLIVRLLPGGRSDHREKIWDIAAGSLVVEEAGGRVSDLVGAPLDFTTGRLLSNNIGILASNGLLHETALDALRRVYATGLPGSA